MIDADCSTNRLRGTANLQAPRTRAADRRRPDQRVDVGMEESASFPVVKRLIGPSGANLKRIREACPNTVRYLLISLRLCKANQLHPPTTSSRLKIRTNYILPEYWQNYDSGDGGEIKCLRWYRSEAAVALDRGALQHRCC